MGFCPVSFGSKEKGHRDPTQSAVGQDFEEKQTGMLRDYSIQVCTGVEPLPQVYA